MTILDSFTIKQIGDEPSFIKYIPSHLEGWRVSLEVSAEFYAKPQHKEAALKDAKNRIRQRLYADALPYIGKIKQAVYAEDADYAIKLLNELEDTLVLKGY